MCPNEHVPTHELSHNKTQALIEITGRLNLDLIRISLEPQTGPNLYASNPQAEEATPLGRVSRTSRAWLDDIRAGLWWEIGEWLWFCSLAKTSTALYATATAMQRLALRALSRRGRLN